MYLKPYLPLLVCCFHFLSFFLYVLDCSDVEECIFRIFVHLTIKDCLESTNSFFYWYINTFDTGKVLCYMEWLGKEFLNLSCSEYCNLIFICKLFHTKNSNDIL